MSILRTVEDFRYGVLLHTDIINTVRRFLEICRDKANGVAGINVPSTYNIVLDKLTDDNHVVVKLVYQQTISTQVPVHYDYDSDYFQEGFGHTNISHYETKLQVYDRENCYKLPISIMMKPKKDIEAWVLQYKDKLLAEQKEKQRQQQIKTLEEQLVKLKASD